MSYVAFDTETYPFEMGAILPKIVCASFAERSRGAIVTDLVGNADPLDMVLHDMLHGALEGRHEIVAHNAAFDLGVISANFPSLLPLVFQALDAGKVHDTIIREKLLLLGTTGSLEYLPLPDGTNLSVDYSLAGLEKRYLGRDRSDQKDFQDQWRGNYKMLDGHHASNYPVEAREYAIEDAEGALRVFERQEETAYKKGFCWQTTDWQGADFALDRFQVGVDFALQLMSSWGIRCDEAKRDEIAALLREQLRPERMKHLLALGILEPPVAPRLMCVGKPNERWTKGKREKISNKKLHAFVVEICNENGVDVTYNDPTEKMLEKAEKNGIPPDQVKGNVCVNKDVLEDIQHLHPALEEYAYRQFLSKLVNTELPRMSGPIIHPRFNILVATGRTSSSASDKYPSANIQNVSAVKKLHDEDGEDQGEINIRHAYVARKGRVLCSVDYNQLEFCSMGQQCYRFFGYSVMRDLINAGKDPHAYLGAQIALHQHEDFIAHCMLAGTLDAMAVYEFFKSCDKSTHPDVKGFYKQYRKLAKPVGFGFPGGLGARKFVGFAKAHPYYVKVDVDQAKDLKNIWLNTFVEMRDYFKLLNSGQLKDIANPEKFRYTTPLGMVRAGCNYTAAANGLLLQSPAAEGAKLAVWEVVKACYCPGYNKILYGQKPVAFIHDEILFEFDDDQHVTERAHEAARLMIAAMQALMPDVQIRAEPALMYRWDKFAEPVYENGRLVPWDRDRELAAQAA